MLYIGTWLVLVIDRILSLNLASMKLNHTSPNGLVWLTLRHYSLCLNIGR